MEAVFMSRAVKPTVIPKYEPTPRDREAMAAYFARKNARKPSPRNGGSGLRGRPHPAASAAIVAAIAGPIFVLAFLWTIAD
jgi:hypothetical protein